MPADKTETTAIDHLRALEIELIAAQVYGFTHKGNQWKKWPILDRETKKPYLDGVKSGINLILHNRALP